MPVMAGGTQSNTPGGSERVDKTFPMGGTKKPGKEMKRESKGGREGAPTEQEGTFVAVGEINVGWWFG